MTLLEIQNLCVTKGERSILANLNLQLHAGEVHALIGTNGTGKSTLATTIMGCQGGRVTAGVLDFAGESLLPLTICERARRGISLAWQEPARIEGLRVDRYLSLRQPQRSAAEALELVGLEPQRYLKRHVDQSLSGGERKRIELASLLTLPLRLAILDEPDSGIDLLSTRGIFDVISAFRRSKTAVLLITHREEISRIADQASQICFGRIVFTGTPRAVADHYLGRQCQTCNGWECGHERS